MKIEVNKAFKRRQYREKRKQERIDLAPAVAAQPKSRTIRYDNVRSAMAEEIVLAQCLSDAAMIAETEGLKPEEFSSPLLGRVFEQLQQQSRQGMVPSVAGLTDFTGEEMAHIAGILQRNPGPVSEQAMRDSIQVIRQMHEFKTADTKDTLMELQRKLQESKGIKA